MFHVDELCAGPIGGLYLPPTAWDLLWREKIQTIDQLMANADRLEQFDGVEPRMAHVIRQALAYATLREESMRFEEHPGPWCA